MECNSEFLVYISILQSSAWKIKKIVILKCTEDHIFFYAVYVKHTLQKFRTKFQELKVHLSPQLVNKL
jgi:hypothetical protein